MSGLPYQPSSPTSQAAAASMEDASKTQREVVLACFELCGERGATRDEIVNWTDIQIPSVTALVNRLLHDRILIELKETRTTRSGRAAVVLRLKKLPEPSQPAMFGTEPAPRRTQYS